MQRGGPSLSSHLETCSPALASPRPGGWGFRVHPAEQPFLPPRLEAFCLAACQERVRGCRPGHKGGLGRNLWACRVIHQTLSRLPAPTPSHSIPLPAAAGPHPLWLLSPVTWVAKRISGPGGAEGTHHRHWEKANGCLPRIHPQCVKTQQVAVAWRKVAFVALSESPHPASERNKCWRRWGQGRERDRATPHWSVFLPSQSRDWDPGSGLTLTLAKVPASVN